MFKAIGEWWKAWAEKRRIRAEALRKEGEEYWDAYWKAFHAEERDYLREQERLRKEYPRTMKFRDKREIAESQRIEIDW